MGSNTLAALAVQPPADPTRQIAQDLAIKGAIQNQQYQQQAQPIELQQHQLQLQQGRLAAADQQAMTNALHEWDGKDPNELPGLVLRHGGSANAVFGLKGQIVDWQTKAANLTKDQLDNLNKTNDIVAGHLEAVKSAPADQKPTAYQNAMQDLVEKGLAKPGQFPDQYPGDQWLDLEEKKHVGQKTIVEQAQKQKEEENKAAQLNIEQQKFNATQPGGTQENPEQKFLRLDAAQKQGQQLSDADKSFLGSYKTNKTMVPAYNFNLQNAGATGTGGQPSAIAKSLADGTMKWQDVVSARTPMAVKQQLLSEVKAIKPDYNTGDFSLEQAVRKEFTSGDAAKNLTAFNTAIEHAQQLSQATDALDNTKSPIFNQLKNTLGYQFGEDKQTNFNVIKNALSGEISKVFKGGQATDAEIKEVQGPFNSANSPAQLKGAINNAISLMNSKRDALKQQYEAGRQAQPNFGGNAGASKFSVQAPNGKTYTFKDQASLDAFKQKAGIQ